MKSGCSYSPHEVPFSALYRRPDLDKNSKPPTNGRQTAIMRTAGSVSAADGFPTILRSGVVIAPRYGRSEESGAPVRPTPHSTRVRRVPDRTAHKSDHLAASLLASVQSPG